MDQPYPSYTAIKIRVADPPGTAGLPVLERLRADYLRDPLSADPYGRSVRDVLNTLNGQVTGRVILEAIQGSGHQIVIQPYNPTPQDPQNAYASPTDWSAATPQGQQALQCGGPNQGQPLIQSTYWGFSSAPVEGTGSGSNSVVYFTPSMWSAPGGPGSRADQILLHEMLHAYRQMRGRLLCMSAGMGNYDTFEEYFAIVITNMYMSETTGSAATPLRAHHHGFSTLPYPQLFPDSQQNREYLRRIHRENSELTARLAFRSRGPFNPFRDLFLQTTPDQHSSTATA